MQVCRGMRFIGSNLQIVSSVLSNGDSIIAEMILVPYVPMMSCPIRALLSYTFTT